MRPLQGLDACVEAQLPLASRLAAADALRATLWRTSIVFVFAAGLAGYLASRWVTGPARRLLAAVAGASRGETDPAIVASGPAEMQALGAAMHSLSSDVSRRLNNAETARREAEAASAAKDQFVAMLSQELRTLVTTVNEWIHDVPGTRASGS
jgi:signal transduction histidine kinase